MKRPGLIKRFHTWIRLARVFKGDPQAARVILYVKRSHLTFLDTSALIDLYMVARKVEQLSLPGLFIEAGCALGGSSLVLATAKAKMRPLWVYDTFTTIPPPSENDGPDAHRRYAEIVSGRALGPGDTTYYGYRGDILPEVRMNFGRLGFDEKNDQIHFVKGLFQERLVVNQPVALAHIDGDWYDSVMVCLERIVPNLQPGGYIIIDDYTSWSGCRRAVDEYFADKKGKFAFEMKSRLHIRRVANLIETRKRDGELVS